MSMIANVNIIGNELLTPALTVCTAFATVFRYQGIFGMYMLYVYIMTLSVVMVLLISKVKHLHITFVIAIGYFLLFTFFTNPVVYPITAMMIIFCFVCYLFYRLNVIQYLNKIKKHLVN